MILFVQPDRFRIASGDVHNFFSYENYVHEAGFARLTISLVAATLLFLPFQRRQRWAFVTLVIIALLYYVPVFFFGAFPNIGTTAFFRNFPQPRSSGLFVFWSSYLLAAFMLLGLILAVPSFRKMSERE